MSIEEQYKEKLKEYKRKWKEVRDLQKDPHATPRLIHAIDTERDEIHRQLRKLGEDLGKNSQDVNFDILAMERNLSEYQLPGFILMKATEYELNMAVPADRRYRRAFIVEGKQVSEEFMKQYEGFIPFGTEESWHLFDGEGGTFFRAPDNIERRKRAHKLAEQMEGAFFCELYDQDTFHRGQRFFGIAFSSKNLEQILSFIREHRADISIEKEYFSEEQLLQDFQDIVREDIQYILDSDFEEHGEYEYHLKRYQDTLNQYFLPGVRNERYRELVVDYVQKGLKEAMKKEIDKELERVEQQIERSYPELSQLPKREGMGRRYK
ncbi:hypothetical protein KKG22_02290 [Patescibacteria group bacterium]|nr:hypothetical protein [Patescibacteria group bacterium]MBU1721818.1 hypothetical protein [Patescibacteria group bacterium]MBU1901687.1 hypothetical protein [Patescibacteria group bacterium]